MSEFKIPPYLYFYVNDWSGDPELKRLDPAVKGFYIDLICQLHKCFPYGYCSLINHKKTKQLQKQVNLTSNQEVNLMVQLLLTKSVADQLKLAENIEGELHMHLPYTPDQNTAFIRVLEERGIISRSPEGIIYVRRMVKDFKRKVVAYLNGSKGGNPNAKSKKTGTKSSKSSSNKSLIKKKLQKQVNQNTGGTGNPTADYIYNNTISGREEGTRDKKPPIFSLQKIYDSTFEDLQRLRFSKTLTVHGFTLWKKFVDLIIEKDFTDIFIANFITPQDFQKLEANSFKEDKWEDVIKLILGSGIKPDHNLYYRIPQYEKYVDKSRKKGNPDLGIITDNPDDYKFTPPND